MSNVAGRDPYAKTPANIVVEALYPGVPGATSTKSSPDDLELAYW
jgi:hypothetical protein